VQQQQQADRYSSIVKTFFDRAPPARTRGPLLPPTTSTNQPTTPKATTHVRELSPPTVPTILPTLILLLDLLEHSHSQNTAQRIQRVESVDGRRVRAQPLHDSSRNHPAGRPRMAKQRVAMAE